MSAQAQERGGDDEGVDRASYLYDAAAAVATVGSLAFVAMSQSADAIPIFALVALTVLSLFWFPDLLWKLSAFAVPCKVRSGRIALMKAIAAAEKAEDTGPVPAILTKFEALERSWRVALITYVVCVLIAMAAIVAWIFVAWQSPGKAVLRGGAAAAFRAPTSPGVSYTHKSMVSTSHPHRGDSPWRRTGGADAAIAKADSNIDHGKGLVPAFQARYMICIIAGLCSIGVLVPVFMSYTNEGFAEGMTAQEARKRVSDSGSTFRAGFSAAAVLVLAVACTYSND